MYACTIRMILPRQRREDALRVLGSLVGPVRSQPGCTGTDLMTDARDDRSLVWMSRWRARPDLERHLRSGHFRRILAVLDLAAEAPQVSFECGDEVRGIDLIAEVLGAEGALPAFPDCSQMEEQIKGESQS